MKTDFEKAIKNIQNRLSEISKEVEELNMRELSNFLQKPKIALHSIEIGEKGCEESPIGLCVYDSSREDWDVCIFCDNPKNILGTMSKV